MSGVTWSSSNTAIATVNNGVVTGVSNGTATISFTDGSSTYSCSVQVRKNGGTTYVYSSSLPRETKRTISAGTAYIIRFYPYEAGYYSFFTSPESTTTLTDTTIALYSDAALTNVIAFDDDGGYATHGCVSAYLNANTAYYFVLSAYGISSTGVVTYNIMKGLPVSGAEIAYNPDLWNYTWLGGETNCYAYALNCQSIPSDANHMFLQIGQSVLGDYGLDSSFYTPDGSEILYYVQQDAANWGFAFKEVSRNEMCASGRYKVALVVDPYHDFHWYRQNADGTWSHKPGGTNVRNTDNSSEIIYDPATANRDNGYGLNYEYVIGFYEVTPLNIDIATMSLQTQNIAQDLQRVLEAADTEISSLSTIAKSLNESVE